MDGKTIGFWVSPKVDKLVRQMAKQDDVSMSKLMNRLIKAEVQRRKEEQYDARR